MFEHCRYNVSSNSYLLIYREMAGRNGCDIVEALQAMAQVMGHAQQALQAQQNNQDEGGEGRGLSRFQRNNPLTFKRRYDLEDAQTWLQEIEKIFGVIVYINARHVLYETRILTEEAKYL